MELNEKVVKELSSRIKIDEKVLSEALTTADKTIEIDGEFLTGDEKTSLETNLKKQGYDSGKLAEREMTLKNLKKDLSLDIEANSIKELFEKNNDLIKSQFDGDTDKKVKELNDDLAKVRQTLTEKDNQIIEIESTYKKKFKESSSNNLIKDQISKIKIDIPEQVNALGEKEIEKYIESKQKQYFTIFKAGYEIDYDENEKPLFKVNGEVLKDNVQNPLQIDSVMQKFAQEQYLTISDNKRSGRGGKSSSQASGDSFKGMTEADFYKAMKSKGIEAGTSAMTPFFLKWKEQNK